jgi:hypothetical protein
MKAVCIMTYHSGCAVQVMNCLRSFEHWDRGFESYSRQRHGCLCAFILYLCVYILCIGSGLATG